MVNVADLWKFTPLHEASAKGKFEICRLLLKVGQIQYSVVVFERAVGAVNLLQMKLNDCNVCISFSKLPA